MPIHRITHRVHFYETDTMGVVHHSNYLRFMEEARVDWMRRYELLSRLETNDTLVAAVLGTGVSHFRPAFFDDLLSVDVEVRPEKAKFRFQYRITSQRYSEPIVVGYSLHILVNEDLKPVRFPLNWSRVLTDHQWTEDWLESLENFTINQDANR